MRDLRLHFDKFLFYMMVVFAILLVGQVSVMLLHWDLMYSFALGLLVCILLIFDFGVVVGVKLMDS